jgi:uncharacterized protein (TIGR02646 family)
MRSIQKRGGGGFPLRNSHDHPPQTSYEATSRWNNFRDKAQVLQYLLEEQYALCCYSELRPDLEGLGYHIEHVENKSQNPSRTFDYGNLAASAPHSDDLATLAAEGKDVFGGHAPGKQKAVDLQQFVSCHQPDCARFFAYDSYGRVTPSIGLDPVEKARAEYTIDLLNLNSSYLVPLRRRWWDELQKLVDQHIDDDWDLEALASVDLIPSHQKLSPFFSITRQIFGPVAEKVLREQFPKP